VRESLTVVQVDCEAGHSNCVGLMTKLLLLTCVLAASLFGQQSMPSRKNATAIAKEASGGVVSIVMSDKEGHPVTQGSGFLISKDGCVLTNYHVIKSGASAVIKLPSGAFFAVDGVRASDKDRDVAIIKARGTDFRALILGDSSRLQVGEEVVAIGSPLSLESTVSNGIVSAIRTIEDKGGRFVQITAPISPGSSGGPLFNMAGEVVGITSAGIKGGENLNFAIPINDVKPMINSVSEMRRDDMSALPDEAEPRSTEPATGPSTQSVQNGPSLEETMSWMQNAINNDDIANDSFTSSDGYHSSRTKMDYSKCVVSVNETMTGSPSLDTTATYDLKDIDPSSIRNTGRELELKTTNNAQTILFEVKKPFKMTSFDAKSRFLIKESGGRDRFSKALLHAIMLCGGKPSAF
jgi:S1-C subfamily serine protease